MTKLEKNARFNFKKSVLVFGRQKSAFHMYVFKLIDIIFFARLNLIFEIRLTTSSPFHCINRHYVRFNGRSSSIARHVFGCDTYR